MSQICILTDSTAQFISPVFPGHELVSLIPLRVQLGERPGSEGTETKTSHLPVTLEKGVIPILNPPSVEGFSQTFLTLGRKYREIVAILISSHLSSTIAQAQEAASAVKCGAMIHIIDSQTTAVGLGLLVQAAAEAAERGISGIKISRLVRSLIPRVYTVFCVQSLTYLACSGHLDPAQAIIGEMLGVTPFLILENGRLVPIQKVRSSRHLVDLLHEFISEFTNLKHVALLQGVPPFEQEVRNLRERINVGFPAMPLTEHTLNPALASIIGPRSLGVVVMEHCSDEI